MRRNKSKIKCLIILVIAMATLFGAVTASAATGWKTVNGKQVYYVGTRKANGLTKVGSNLYFFNSGVPVKKSFLTAGNGKRYYFSSAGKAATGIKTVLILKE